MEVQCMSKIVGMDQDIYYLCLYLLENSYHYGDKHSGRAVVQEFHTYSKGTFALGVVEVADRGSIPGPSDIYFRRANVNRV